MAVKRRPLQRVADQGQSAHCGPCSAERHRTARHAANRERAPFWSIGHGQPPEICGPVATLFGLRSGLADLDEHSWHGAHIGHAAPWKELPLALSLKRRDSEEPLLSRSAWMGSARKLAVTFRCSAIRKSEAMRSCPSDA